MLDAEPGRQLLKLLDLEVVLEDVQGGRPRCLNERDLHGGIGGEDRVDVLREWRRPGIVRTQVANVSSDAASSLAQVVHALRVFESL